MWNYYTGCIKKYVEFTGCATRSEYWYFVLVNFLISLGIALIATIIRVPLLSTLYGLFVLLPGLAVFMRRMHDVGRSGWNWLWGLIPVVGWIIVLIFAVTPSKMTDNKYRQ